MVNGIQKRRHVWQVKGDVSDSVVSALLGKERPQPDLNFGNLVFFSGLGSPQADQYVIFG